MAIPKYVLRVGYAFLFLLALSRFYTLLITLGVVPDFPDPFMEFLALGQEKFDELLGGRGSGRDGKVKESGSWNVSMGDLLGSVVGSAVGMVAFGVMLKVYAPKADGQAGKKGGQGRGRQYMIIFGRIVQCILFLGRECAVEALWSSNGCGVDGEGCSTGWPCVWRIVDFGLSAVVAVLEVNKVSWEGGLIDRAIEMARDMVIGDDDDESETENEGKEVVDGKINKKKVPVGKGRKGKKQR